MKAKLILSMLVILVAIVAAVGGTMAWFTDTAEIPTNTFEAGTVILDAEDIFFGTTGNVLENWNPGDCTPKLVSLKYLGSKKAFLRMEIVEEWKNIGALLDSDVTYDDNDYKWDGDPDATLRNVNWFVYTGDGNYKYEIGEDDLSNQETLFIIRDGKAIKNPHITFDANDWQEWNYDGKWVYNEYDKHWYYNGVIDGQIDDNSFEVIIFGLVCVDGLETDNEYQGAIYTIKISFDAIQSSNDAEQSWNMKWEDNKWFWFDEADWLEI